MKAVVEKNYLNVKREKRAVSIAATGLVYRSGGIFRVSNPLLSRKQTACEVFRDELGKVRCTCLEFEEMLFEDKKFQCEHIMAVKFSLFQKSSEHVTKKSNEVVYKNEAESDKAQKGEQQANEKMTSVLVKGQTIDEMSVNNSFTDREGKNMGKENIDVKNLFIVEKPELIEAKDNVVSMNFVSTLRNLRQNVNPDLVKHSVVWHDSKSNIHNIDNIQWQIVADTLDEQAPNWKHTVKDIRQIGNIITVTVAITIDGITREGLGTGLADCEMGIQKAEHDALKRAATKFGFARQLFKEESDITEITDVIPFPQKVETYPVNPIAVSLMDLISAKQLGLIRAISREIGVDADKECETVLSCKTNELSKKAASVFINHLQDLQKKQVNVLPLSKAS